MYKFLLNTVQLKGVITDSPDAVAAVISLFHHVTNLAFLDSIWLKTGSSNEQRLTPMHSLTSQYGLYISCLLLAINVISGCDSISSFSRIGKRKHSRHLKRKLMSWQISSLSLQCTSMVAAIQFVCSLYQENKATSNINELQYEIFIKTNVSRDSLPPTIKHLFGSQDVCQY